MKHLEDLSLLVKGLNESNSRKHKITTLKSFSQCQRALSYIYNPHQKFNITAKNCIKLKDKLSSTDAPSDSDLFAFLDKLVDGSLSGHDAIIEVSKWINKYPEHEDLIYRIVDKDLKCSMGVSVINSAFPDLIPEFKVALADKYNDKTKSIVNKFWFISRKLDGCVSPKSTVEFDNGDKLQIGTVIDEKIKGKIKSFNHKTGKVEFKNITGWFSDIDDKNENFTQWYSVVLENGIKIEITGNDLLYITSLKCYRRVDELNGDEEVLFF